ncbi:MAG TPA: helicase-related protein [Thermoplasmata archaeon]|nr:helicase-related protein [Thermoplasmata archaeon]
MSASSRRRRAPRAVPPAAGRGDAGSARRQPTLEEFGEGGDGAPPAPAVRPPWRPPPGVPGVWAVEGGRIGHPLLVPGVLRALPFQIDLARIALDDDLLVVLPTGLGKTAIAALVAAELLRRDPGKLLVLAPTRPLVQQHADAFRRWFVDLPTARFSGTVRRPVREGAWDGARAIFATPQLVVNDLAAGRYTLAEVALVVFDEAHHAVGRYAYVPIAARYRADRPSGGRVLGLTASPGGRDERIDEVVAALGVSRIEARGRDDPGVKEHVQPVEVEYRWVALPDAARRVQALLQTAATRTARRLQQMGYLRKKPIGSVSVKDLIALRGEIFARPGPMVRKFGPLFHQLVLLHLHHAQERLETQGVEPFLRYVDRVRRKEKPGRGDRAFVALEEVATAEAEATAFLARAHTPSHPKLDALIDLVRAERDRPRDRPLRLLVFAQYRDTIRTIQEALEADGLEVGRFVGQATRDDADRGMSQGDQAKILAAFRAGRFPVLVASSVAEEGLDVPDVDVVVFFEAVPSEIRAIQRRGRTGRSSVGRVVVLLTEETRDVGYQRAEARRERAMRQIVRRLATQVPRRRRDAGTDDPAAAPGPPEARAS